MGFFAPSGGNIDPRFRPEVGPRTGSADKGALDTRGYGANDTPYRSAEPVLGRALRATRGPSRFPQRGKRDSALILARRLRNPQYTLGSISFRPTTTPRDRS